MNRKSILILLVLVLTLSLTACGGKDADETIAPVVPDVTAAQAPALADYSMTTSTWSSPNGATVHLTAIPEHYAEGQSASFVIRLEGADVLSVPCAWDGKAYTADAELNAADGYSYYLILTDAAGVQSEAALNTPAMPVYEALVNMASSLESWCNLTVTESETAGDKLTITAGAAQLQLPRITNEGETISCQSAVLVLTFEGAEVGAAELTVPAPNASGAWEMDLAGTVFDIPALEDDQQLALRLDVTLSNNQTLTSPGITWFYSDGALLLAVG